MGEWFGETAFSGALVLAIPVALVAGLVSFFSPCVVPLLPGYLSYMTGLSAADLESSKRGRMVAGALLFVLGFSLVFMSYGALFGNLGFRLEQYQRTVSIVVGALVILLGVAFIGWVPFLQRDVRIHSVPAVGLAAAPLLGALFGIGWTPCLGPTLAAVLGLAMSDANALRGALLTLFYCLGLGVPFVLAALGFRRFMGAVGWVRRHQRLISYIGGGLLILVGIALITGWWDWLVVELRSLFPTVTTAV
ncbi:MAG: cytochrome c biogenesis CcdA family protein [Nocardioidaceae bacterium]